MTQWCNIKIAKDSSNDNEICWNKVMVSIIMPCYNDGRYILEAIQSVKEQTYTSWELIIIDDGSDDRYTIDIINSIQDDRIHKYRTDHLRPAGARNYGISKAVGKYILPLDSDDKIDSTYIEKAVKIIDGDVSVGAVYCFAEFFGEKTGRWELPNYSFEKMLIDNIVFVSALFLKEDWETLGGYNTDLIYGMEDYDFWIGILSTGKRIHQIKEVLFYYRIKHHSRTTSFQSDVSHMQDAYKKIYERHIRFYHDIQDQYCLLLRDTLIEQVAIRHGYEEYFVRLNWLKNTRMAKIIKKLVLRK